MYDYIFYVNSLEVNKIGTVTLNVVEQKATK